MKKRILVIFLFFLLLSSCDSAMFRPYLELDVDSVYTSSDVSINYEYSCEKGEQRCVYSLYNQVEPDKAIISEDGFLPNSGVLHFTSLTTGDYKIDFSVYSYRDGTSTKLNFLDTTEVFTVNLP